MVTVKKVQWILDGPNKLKLIGPTSLLKPTKENDKITSINVEDKFSIELGKTINYKNKIPYKVNNIEKIYNGYELIVAYPTKASLFMMPMFGGDIDLYLYNSLFVNAFIGVKDDKYLGESCLALLYRFSGSTLFLKFEQALRRFTCFREMIDPSPHYVLFVFNIPLRFLDDYNKFILGKYSRFSSELKENILKFHQIDNNSSIGQILYKSKKRRLRMQESLGIEIPKDFELFDIPKLEEEIFDKNYYV